MSVFGCSVGSKGNVFGIDGKCDEKMAFRCWLAAVGIHDPILASYHWGHREQEHAHQLLPHLPYVDWILYLRQKAKASNIERMIPPELE